MITLIAAVAANGVIGKNNSLPWRLPSDLKHFKRTTLGFPMLMGRKTFESFGSRPLPKRHHIILSHQYGGPNDESVTWVKTLTDAFDLAERLSSELFVIGGANVYHQTIDRADRLILSEIPHAYEGDAFFPEVGPQWKCIEGVTVAEPDELDYVVRTYHRG